MDAAYGMLGTVGEAQDAVQEAWLRLERSDPGESVTCVAG
jgi:DNA-directed RNA polymerase specialized sigma24 family protein